MSLRKIKYILLSVAAFTSLSAFGQNISSFRNSLSSPSNTSAATVSTTEHGSAADVVRKYDATAKSQKIQGYRIRIFFDNGQNARSAAQGTESRFRSEFPGTPTYLVYENPAWMVTVGNCATIDEALMLWNRVKKSFSTAFLWRGEIPVNEILRYDAASNNESSITNENISTTQF